MTLHIEAATRDDGNNVFGALAADAIQNFGFCGAAAEEHAASNGRNAPGPDGSGSLKTLIIYVFSCRRHKATIDKLVFF